MYAVGVGKAVEEELREIASEPSELHVSYSPDFGTMTHLLENLKGSICPGERISPGLLVFCCPASHALSSALHTSFSGHSSLSTQNLLFKPRLADACLLTVACQKRRPQTMSQTRECFGCISESRKPLICCSN